MSAHHTDKDFGADTVAAKTGTGHLAGLSTADVIAKTLTDWGIPIHRGLGKTGVVGTMQAAEALKLIAGVGRPLTGRLLMIDGRAMEFTEMRTSRQTRCAVCATR